MQGRRHVQADQLGRGPVAQERPSQTISRCGSLSRIAAAIRSITRGGRRRHLSSGSLSGLKLIWSFGIPW